MPTRSPNELKGDIQRAVQILELFTNPNKGRDVKMLIPPSVLRDAHGIVFIRLYRIGFMLSAKSGNGIIIARLPDGSWSAPSGVSMSSLGFGHQAGGEVIDSIIVMNYRAAVKAFFDGGGQLQLGVGASLAAGPYGRAADVSASASNTSHIAATYAYSSSKGLYLGYSFEGSKISERVNTNQAYYGRPISASEILTGAVPPVHDAARLYDILNSLGAGPRPGLPFAPTKPDSLKHRPSVLSTSSAATSTHSMSPMPYAAPPRPPSSSPPKTHYNMNNSMPPPPQQHKNDEYEDPPPPYQPSESYKPNTSDAKTPYQQPPSTPTTNNTTTTTYNNNSLSSPMSFGNNQQADAITKPLPSPVQQQAGPSSSYFQQNNAAPSSSLATPAATYAQPPAQSTPFDEKKKPIPQPASSDSMTVVVAKYDFHSDQPTDLSFQAGDHIIVTKRLDNRESWWEGEIGSKRGFFPANYTEDLD